jgi:hypothetical protein
MKKAEKNKTIFLFFVLAVFFKAADSQIISPFNSLEVKDTSPVYSVIVSGHFHGASNNESTYPAATLLSNIDTINSLKSSFLISLGDMFIDVNEMYLKHYQKSLFNKLGIPLFNAVGNHDLSNGNLYEKKYGKTFFSFYKGSELYIVLNTEVNDGSIKNEQLSFFKDEMQKAIQDSIKNIFIFSHRPIWAEQIKKYEKLFRDNTRSSFGKNNFSSVVFPILKNLSNKKNIYWISGSMGGGPASFFYDKDEDSHITFMQTAIRDLPRDAILLINLNNGAVCMKGISLTGESLLPVEKYDLSYWNKTILKERQFNYRLLPLYIKSMLLSIYFWVGFIVAIIFIFSIILIKEKWKIRK